MVDTNHYECPKCGMRVSVFLARKGKNGQEEFEIFGKCLNCKTQLAQVEYDYQG
ncbi:MAG: hypothetical protein ACTSPY_06945 [Candidatus Helarchaeota archaeon]